MNRKHIVFSMFLMVLLPGVMKAQQTKFEIPGIKPGISVEKIRGFGGLLTSGRLLENRIKIRHEVYWSLGVDNPLFQIDKSFYMVYSYIDKPKLDRLSDDIPVKKSGTANLSLLPTSQYQLNIQDNLAPSIQITF